MGTVEELRAFLSHVHDDRLGALWSSYAVTGRRRGEPLGLCRPDIDLDAGRLRIERTLVGMKGRTVESTPKTKRGYRTITLDATTLAALREHRRRQAAGVLPG